ncbi:hypothetical protein VCUG_02851, partial [Vavraia culicis subsp. floridensis]
WVLRQRGEDKVITRLYAVNPEEKERFYLRMLLLNVRGATSFDDLRSANNVVYGTFEEAARARNLLQDDNEWKNVLSEAAMTETSDHIRKLLAYICVFNRPHDALGLFNDYVNDMCNDIVNKIYGDVTNMADSEDLTNRTILTTNNNVAKEINDRVLDLMIGNEVTYTSADSIVTEDNDVVANYPLEFLNKQQPSGMPPHKLVLKRGALIMLLRNLDPANGLLNGTRPVVDELHTNFIIATIVTGSRKDSKAVILRIDMAPSETQLPFILKRRQFPVLVSFAMTIHKSQGQSFDKVGVYLHSPVFVHGQLYVALSRVRYENGLRVYVAGNGCQGKRENDKVYTRNVVHTKPL